jgi:sugar/nucleoside kinase (ribokinase family)
MPEPPPLDIVTVGHFVIDLLSPPGALRPKTSLGGPPTFVSLSASKLGARVGVISTVGQDFQRMLAWLRERNVDVSRVRIVEDAFTTSYQLTYGGKGRRLRLRTQAPRIELRDVPECLRARAVHVAPVADELHAEVILQLKKKVQLLSIDPQGFLRKLGQRGQVTLETPKDTAFLEHCDVFKSSLHEARVLTGHSRLAVCIERIRECGVGVVLITMGKNGLRACFGNDVYHVPACKPKGFRDPTGAGDTFIGGFLAEYVRDSDPLWCCCVGSAAASFVVENVGSKRFGEKSAVY